MHITYAWPGRINKSFGIESQVYPYYFKYLKSSNVISHNLIETEPSMKL